MKAPEELNQLVRDALDGFLDCEAEKVPVFQTRLRQTIEKIIAEIQRDARRQGMTEAADWCVGVGCTCRADILKARDAVSPP